MVGGARGSGVSRTASDAEWEKSATLIGSLQSALPRPVVCLFLLPPCLRPLISLHTPAVYASRPSYPPPSSPQVLSARHALLLSAVQLRVSANFPSVTTAQVAQSAPRYQSPMAPRRYRHVAQIPKPTLLACGHHRRRGPHSRPTDGHHSHRADIGLQAEGAHMDRQGTSGQSVFAATER